MPIAKKGSNSEILVLKRWLYTTPSVTQKIAILIVIQWVVSKQYLSFQATLDFLKTPPIGGVTEADLDRVK